MVDDELIQLYRTHRAGELDEQLLFVELIQALEGDDVQRERALAIVYELRDRYGVFE